MVAGAEGNGQMGDRTEMQCTSRVVRRFAVSAFRGKDVISDGNMCLPHAPGLVVVVGGGGGGGDVEVMSQ